MKNIHFKISVCAIALFALVFSAAGKMPTLSGTRLTAAEAKTLARSASTPEEHLRLAEYFRSDALEEAAFAALAEQLAETTQRGAADPMRIRCREIAHSAAKASEHALRMALQQERLAAAMRDEPQRHSSHGSR